MELINVSHNYKPVLAYIKHNSKLIKPNSNEAVKLIAEFNSSYLGVSLPLSWFPPFGSGGPKIAK